MIGDLKVIDYFTKLKILRDKLEVFQPIPFCICATLYSYNAINVVRIYQDNDYIIKFLQGLNDKYFKIKSQALLLNLLSSINRVFFAIIQ